MMNIIVMGLGLGLVTNFHCVGMCGPISMALPINRKNNFTASFGILIYTIGRSLGYALLGIGVGIIGVSAELFGVLQILSIITGVFIILFAWGAYFKNNIKIDFINKWISRSMGRIFKDKRPEGKNKRLLMFGFINAFLPCGMVYVALLSALNAGSMEGSALFMIFFGLGTLPGFLVLALLKNRFTAWSFLSNKIVIASLISIVGLAIVLRGLNLGIPYISPKMEMVEKMIGNEKVKEVEVSCCSKKGTENCESLQEK